MQIKTTLLATLLAGTVCALVYLGKMTPDTACTIALFALAGFAVTFRDALATNQVKILALLDDVAVAGAAARTHNRAAQLAAAVAAAEDGSQLVAAIEPSPAIAIAAHMVASNPVTARSQMGSSQIDQSQVKGAAS